MFLVSGPELAAAACMNGIAAGLPRQNARSLAEFDGWLGQVRAQLDRIREDDPSRPVGPLAVNISRAIMRDALDEHLDVLERHGVELVISAQGDPTALTRRVHDWGGVVFHDATTVRFAEKAVEAGVDGIVCIGAGGGGHSGLVSPFVLIPRVREMFDGVVIAAGAIADGRAILAAQALGADLVSIGTRFIATRESLAPNDYKRMIVEAQTTDLDFSADVSGLPVNWLVPSYRRAGLDPANLPRAAAIRDYAHLPDGVRPWKDIWSAGQAVDLIDDIPTVGELIARLEHEYRTTLAGLSAAAPMTPHLAQESRSI
ncbi:NAD(P)H-dependent flavin oxidoreductase [Microbacterium sp. NPDC055357]